MNLLTIIPISRGIGKEYLTYFSLQQPPLGSLVEVPLRGRTIMGLVTGIETVQSKKTEIKNLPYGIKRMERIAATKFLLPNFMEAVTDIAEYYAATTGAILSVLLPKAILESIDTITQYSSAVLPAQRLSAAGDISSIQAHDEERFGAYKSLIREEFARKKSVFVVLPGREEIRTMQLVLSKGIDQHTYVLHTGLSKKDIIETWKNILATEHPVLIIATGYFLAVPRADIATIIIEGESSRGFSVPARPYLDLRFVAETIAKKNGIRLVYGASLLRVETMYRIKENDIAEFGTMKFRALSEAECVLADMRTPKGVSGQPLTHVKKEFVVIGDTLREGLIQAVENNERSFLLCGRKGLSPITVCGDCGQTVSCENCGAPTVLYKDTFLCRRCGQKHSTEITCSRCRSWKLVPLGIGIETAQLELQILFPDTEIFLMDKDHVKTHKQAETLIKKFFNNSGTSSSAGAILLGTELAIPYLSYANPLQPSIDFSGVVSIDSLFAIPEFRMNEKIMHMLVSIRSATQKKMIVQTRRPEEKLFEYALRGNLSDFYRDEIVERERFGYPPFNTFIKITLEGKKAHVREKMEQAQEMFKPFDLNIFESQSSSLYAVHGLLIVPKTKWPDENLLERLRSLSPDFIIKVDPESLL